MYMYRRVYTCTCTCIGRYIHEHNLTCIIGYIYRKLRDISFYSVVVQPVVNIYRKLRDISVW